MNEFFDTYFRIIHAHNSSNQLQPGGKSIRQNLFAISIFRINYKAI